MQPYLMYGFGIRAKNLPIEVRDRLISGSGLNKIFSWFYEDAAGSTEEDAGIFYIVESSPFSRRKEDNEPDFPWAEDLERLLKFKEKSESEIDARLVELDLLEYKDQVEFLCSVTEI